MLLSPSRAALISLFCFSIPASAQTATPTETAFKASVSPAAQAPVAVVDAFHAALERGDTNAALALLADDALIFESGGVERSKAQYAAYHLAADAAFSQAVDTNLNRRTASAIGSIAWVASEGRATGNYKSKPVDHITFETMVLRSVGPDWKIAHVHWSSAAPIKE